MIRLSLKDESASIPSSPPGDLMLLVSPLDVHVYTLDIPPLKSEHVEGAVRFRLRTLFPGNPEDTEVDWIPGSCGLRVPAHRTPNADGKIIAFAVSCATLADLRARGLQLVAGLTILSRLGPIPKTEGITEARILAAPEWIESAVFSGGVCVRHFSAPISHARDFARSLKKDLPQEDTRVAFVSACLNDDERTKLMDTFKAAGLQPTIGDLDQALSEISAPYVSLFPPPRPAPRLLARHATACLVALNLFAAAAFLDRLAVTREHELEPLKREYEAKRNEIERAEALRGQIERIERELGTAGRLSPDPYSVIAELNARLKGSWLRSLTIRDGSFQIEAEGGDALAVLATLRASPLFANVSLKQAVPSESRGELFSITGEVRHDVK